MLQGQSQGSDVWQDGTLDGYKELDRILCRVDFQDGPALGQVILLQFDHSDGVIPGIQDLIDFSTSDNVVITSAPTLEALPGEDVWAYRFTVDVIDGEHGYVKFHARLAAGSHLIDDESLKITGSESLGAVEIQRPAEAPGKPDLMVIKSGPATAARGEIITYTLDYGNKDEAENDGDGVQLSDILPGEVTYVPGTATDGGVLVGNTLTWDLGDLEEGETGTVSYQVRVKSDTLPGQSFSNFAQIYSSEDDADYSDNSSSVTTLVINNAPVAHDDAYQVNEDAILSVLPAGVMANDTDADGDTLFATLVAGPIHGLLSFLADGSFTYVPAPDYNGLDGFTYTVSDGLAESAVATVTITVNPVNDAPIASDDLYSVNEDNPLAVSAPGVLANDSDVDGDPLTAVLVQAPAHGTLALAANGSFMYVPALNFNGLDSFVYKANDGLADSVNATVTIMVMSVNDAPIANPDHYSLDEEGLLVVPAVRGVLANDTDADGDLLEALLVRGPAHGMLTLNPDGSFQYLGATGYSGIDSFAYEAADGLSESGVVFVTLTIRPVNHAPIARNDTYGVDENQLLSISAPGVLANDTDADGDAMEVALMVGPFHGNVSLNPDGSFTYQPATNYSGADSFTYQTDDGILESAAATVAITVRAVNRPPTVRIINPTNGTVYFALATITIIADAFDPDGSVSKVEFFQGTNLLAQANPGSSYVVWTNVPAGSYEFTARATDNSGASAVSAPVRVTVLERPPSVSLQPVHFNPQTGLFEEIVRISNPSQKALEGARVLVTGLRPGVALFNASGQTNGIAYVQTSLPIAAGGSVDLRIEYYVPDYQTPAPTLTMELVPPAKQPAPPVGIFVPITRRLRTADGGFLVEFNSLADRLYFVQYSSDMVNWKTAWPGIAGLGNRVQWVDNGPPRTESMPDTAACRFYRVLLAP